MKLLSIKFNSFKTVRGDILDIEKDITCLVGINEAGKSNVLLGIEKCGTHKNLTSEDIARHSDDYLKEGATPILEMVLVPSSEEERDELQAVFGVSELREIRLVKEGGSYRVDYPAINYENSTYYLEKQEVENANTQKGLTEQPEGSTKKNNSEKSEITEEEKQRIRNQIIEQVKSMLPKFSYFDSVDFNQYFLPQEGDVPIPELISNPNSHLPVVNLLKLAGIEPQDLASHSTPQEKVKRDTRLELGTDQINQKLLRAFWPVETVQIHITAEGDILKIRIKESREFLPGERSRGLQWALAFNIFFLASTNEKLKNTVLLIDEPGIFLHIEGQRKMISSTFPEIASRGNQIIYTTHLPYLIDKNYPERIRILEKEKEDTKIGNKAWAESEFGSIPEPVRTALGLNVEEAFLFGEQNLIVEGPADHIYLRLILEKFDPELLTKLTIVPAYGVDKVPKVMILAMMSKFSAYGIVDADKDIETIKEQFTKVGIEDPAIENIAIISKNDSIKTIEDIIPASIIQEAVFRVYERECGKRRRTLDKSEISISIPRQQSIEDYFRTKLTSPKHKLLKMDIARAAKNIIEENNSGSISSEWSIAKDLVKGIKQFVGGKKITKAQDGE